MIACTDWVAVACGYTSHPDTGWQPTARHPFPAVSPLVEDGGV